MEQKGWGEPAAEMQRGVTGPALARRQWSVWYPSEAVWKLLHLDYAWVLEFTSTSQQTCSRNTWQQPPTPSP